MLTLPSPFPFIYPPLCLTLSPLLFCESCKPMNVLLIFPAPNYQGRSYNPCPRRRVALQSLANLSCLRPSLLLSVLIKKQVPDHCTHISETRRYRVPRPALLIAARLIPGLIPLTGTVLVRRWRFFWEASHLPDPLDCHA